MDMNAGKKSVLPNKGFKIGACDWNLGKTADPGCFAIAKEIGTFRVNEMQGSCFSVA